MSETISAINHKECYGCQACLNACPVGAIEILEDDEGFLSPCIDERKCLNCGVCIGVCPVKKHRKNGTDRQEFYVGNNKNVEERTVSSSGGIFTLFANWVLENGGCVAGARFDENAKLSHVLTDKKEDLHFLRGSKYLQSNIGYVYGEIKQKLERDSPVLFCGTPCQVNGLLNYLGKDYRNLYSVDLACHGVPSQKTFDEFLSEKFGDGQKYSAINFRDKRNGYSNPAFTVHDDEGKEIFHGGFDESYLKGFGQNLFLRQSCGTCRFATRERCGDVTIADFWSVRHVFPELNYESGISSFIINNEKGRRMKEEIPLS
jgi:coenzyme F420-reducing hydrogenase beta subunit